MTWVQINDTIFYTDTDQEIQEALEALRAAGLGSATVFVGDPDSSDSYKNGQKLFA